MPDQIQRTREHVLKVFRELESEETVLRETVLIRDGHYCGHKFSNDQLDAVWFIEEDEIKIYDANHRLIRVDSQHSGSLKRAA